MISAVLFDVFGTLLDVSTDDYFSPYSHVLFPLQLNEEERICVGRMLYTMQFPTVDDFADRLEQMFTGREIPSANRDATVAELKQDFDRMVPTNGIMQLLPELRRAGLKLALVSNLASPYEQVIRRHAIDRLVDATIYSFEVGHQKPEPQIYATALERIGAAPAETVMIGDDPINDGAGARSVGLHARVVREGSEDAGQSLNEAIRWVLKNAPDNA